MLWRNDAHCVHKPGARLRAVEAVQVHVALAGHGDKLLWCERTLCDHSADVQQFKPVLLVDLCLEVRERLEAQRVVAADVFKAVSSACIVRAGQQSLARDARRGLRGLLSAQGARQRRCREVVRRRLLLKVIRAVHAEQLQRD